MELVNIKKLKITKPLYINTFADIPTNSGLGSSSSFTVGLINALSKLQNKNLSKKKIAEIAYEIEARITNNSLGKQDHYIASFGGIKHIVYKEKKILVSSIILDKKKIKYLFDRMLLIWTNKNRLSDLHNVSLLRKRKRSLDYMNSSKKQVTDVYVKEENLVERKNKYSVSMVIGIFIIFFTVLSILFLYKNT